MASPLRRLLALGRAGGARDWTPADSVETLMNFC